MRLSLLRSGGGGLWGRGCLRIKARARAEEKAATSVPDEVKDVTVEGTLQFWEAEAVQRLEIRWSSASGCAEGSVCARAHEEVDQLPRSEKILT